MLSDKKGIAWPIAHANSLSYIPFYLPLDVEHLYLPLDVKH
jgi:hypothetical protein